MLIGLGRRCGPWKRKPGDRVGFHSLQSLQVAPENTHMEGWTAGTYKQITHEKKGVHDLNQASRELCAKAVNLPGFFSAIRNIRTVFDSNPFSGARFSVGKNPVNFSHEVDDLPKGSLSKWDMATWCLGGWAAIPFVYVEGSCISGWWFPFFIFTPNYLGKMNPFWLIFFKEVETTN